MPLSRARSVRARAGSDVSMPLSRAGRARSAGGATGGTTCLNALVAGEVCATFKAGSQCPCRGRGLCGAVSRSPRETRACLNALVAGGVCAGERLTSRATAQRLSQCPCRGRRSVGLERLGRGLCRRGRGVRVATGSLNALVAGTRSAGCVTRVRVQHGMEILCLNALVAGARSAGRYSQDPGEDGERGCLNALVAGARSAGGRRVTALLTGVLALSQCPCRGRCGVVRVPGILASGAMSVSAHALVAGARSAGYGAPGPSWAIGVRASQCPCRGRCQCGRQGAIMLHPLVFAVSMPLSRALGLRVKSPAFARSPVISLRPVSMPLSRALGVRAKKRGAMRACLVLSQCPCRGRSVCGIKEKGTAPASPSSVLSQCPCRGRSVCGARGAPRQRLSQPLSRALGCGSKSAAGAGRSGPVPCLNALVAGARSAGFAQRTHAHCRGIAAVSMPLSRALGLRGVLRSVPRTSHPCLNALVAGARSAGRRARRGVPVHACRGRGLCGLSQCPCRGRSVCGQCPIDEVRRARLRFCLNALVAGARSAGARH